MKHVTIELKTYWGETKTVPVHGIIISQSIYSCDSKWYVTGTYYIDGVSGPVAQLATLAVCSSHNEAQSKLAEITGVA
jgi:hypothetical protein